jgi:hypothetical protein
MSFTLSGPEAANAAWANFCNPVTLGGWAGCNSSAPSNINQVFGWGDQHSVCVGIPGLEYAVKRCSSGPGAGVYSGQLNEAITAYAHIENHAAGSNTVHGIALGPG